MEVGGSRWTLNRTAHPSLPCLQHSWTLGLLSCARAETGCPLAQGAPPARAMWNLPLVIFLLFLGLLASRSRIPESVEAKVPDCEIVAGAAILTEGSSSYKKSAAGPTQCARDFPVLAESPHGESPLSLHIDTLGPLPHVQISLSARWEGAINVRHTIKWPLTLVVRL